MIVDVMSFNLRYWNEGDGENSWPHRLQAVKMVIDKYQPVVLGTQEGLPTMLAGLDAILPGYERFGSGRDKDRTGEHNAVYYRPDQLKLVEQGQFWLSTEPEVPGSRSWDSSLPRICTWGVFEPIGAGARFAVFNTHLDHAGEEARRNGAEIIWERMAPLAAGGMPCILMGDFNCEPADAPVQLFRSHLRDALMEKNAGGATFHGFSGLSLSWIDYIFATPDVEVVEAAIVKDRVDGRFPSDHFPITARLSLPHQP